MFHVDVVQAGPWFTSCGMKAFLPWSHFVCQQESTWRILPCLSVCGRNRLIQPQRHFHLPAVWSRPSWIISGSLAHLNELVLPPWLNSVSSWSSPQCFCVKNVAAPQDFLSKVSEYRKYLSNSEWLVSVRWSFQSVREQVHLWRSDRWKPAALLWWEKMRNKMWIKRFWVQVCF